jgi:hypothetical protein
MSALDAIDAVHGDGVLPGIPADARPGRGAMGVYRHRRNGSPDPIGVGARSERPALTAAHELGHFLYHQGFGQKIFASEFDPPPAWEVCCEAVNDSATMQTILYGAAGISPRMSGYPTAPRDDVEEVG